MILASDKRRLSEVRRLSGEGLCPGGLTHPADCDVLAPARHRVIVRAEVGAGFGRRHPAIMAATPRPVERPFVFDRLG